MRRVGARVDRVRCVLAARLGIGLGGGSVVVVVADVREGVVLAGAELRDTRAEGETLEELVEDDDDEESNEEGIARDDERDADD